MEASEHVWIGDQITLTFDDGRVPARNTALHAGPGTLTYGQLVALGGDFYGVPGRPISTDKSPTEAFIAAYESLTTAWSEVGPILAVVAEEEAHVQAAIAAGKEPSLAYRELGDSLSVKWNRITGGGSFITDWLPRGRYLMLSSDNWDHFAEHAIAAYTAGHAVAINRAYLARQADGAERMRLLQYAYATNAFADHFLTDLFSSGHLRVPRRELYDQVAAPFPGLEGTVGGLLARCMHNEDGDNGLQVSNQRGESWKAHGDKRLRDSYSTKNRELVVAATQTSADEIWAAYQGRPSPGAALSYVADLPKVQDRTSRTNGSPLFTMIDDRVARRNDVGNRQDYTWTHDWWGWSTLIAISNIREFRKARVYHRGTGAHIGWLGSSTLAYVELVKSEQDAVGVMWQGDSDLYLLKDSWPFDRWLGLSDQNFAGWGLGGAGGWHNPVVYNADQTIALKSDPTRLLCWDRNESCLMWSQNGDTENLVRVDLPLI